MIVLMSLMFACSETNFTQLTEEDVFRQARIQTVDVLLVIDNSCSMIEEQTKLSQNFQSFIQVFEEAEVDWQIGVVTTDVDDEAQRGKLIGGDDEVRLVNAEGRTVDEVAWTRTWGAGAGVVLSLDPTRESAVSNDAATAWCTNVAPSPGAVNPGCGGDGPGRNARYGAVIVTELLADPADVPDDRGEWVEITNISDTAVDLTGWTLIDNGQNNWSFPDGASIAAGAVQVVARSTDVAEATYTTDGDMTLNNADLYLTSTTEGADEIFVENVTQGTTGTGLEMGFEGARLATLPEALVGENAGFIREEANLSLLFVSDEEDSSPYAVSDYLRHFADLKGEDAYRNHTRMNVSGVIGDRAPEFAGEPSCSSANGVADWGKRYVSAVVATEGLVDSICDEDFTPIVNQLGLTLSGLESEFELSEVPELDTLKVALYADASDESKDRDLTIDVDYTYVEERNSIRFEYDQVPASEKYILVEYKVRSGS